MPDKTDTTPAIEMLTRVPWKFEGHKPGDTIRARDFEDREGRGACYVEGRIDMVCPVGSDRYPYAHYKIVPTRRVWNGSELRDAMTEPREAVIVPMETSMDYDNRVELVKRAERPLVKGYSLVVYGTDDERYETVYAVYENGDIWQNGPYIGGTEYFDAPWSKWERAKDGLPPKAYFIGNYKPPA